MYVETTFHDAMEQENSLPGWRQEYRQVSTGGYDGRTAAILLPGVEILRETISVGTEQVFSAPEGSMIFYYYPKRDESQLVHGESALGVSGFALNWTNRVGFMDSDSDLLMLVLRRDLIADAHCGGKKQLIEAPMEQAAFLADWLLSLLGAASQQQHPSPPGNFDDTLADVITDRFELLFQRSVFRETPQVAAAEKIYMKIRDRIFDAPDRPHTVRSLSRDLDVSALDLRASCQNFAQIPLDKMLTLLRLNGARRDLLRARSAPRKVSDIAMDWGFFHWSRFALRYKSLFGERPSDTLRGGTSSDSIPPLPLL
ncbi:helix-turn-helix domain-containing protein [Agrobacterium cavarae]|uniref:helix-turn-helix domain-containing protein n=1 Tax=Agrobacterium cavarae TaxID=2528239 RepID=UPI003FD2E72C